jgi:hypothetical protein
MEEPSARSRQRGKAGARLVVLPGGKTSFPRSGTAGDREAAPPERPTYTGDPGTVHPARSATISRRPPRPPEAVGGAVRSADGPAERRLTTWIDWYRLARAVLGLSHGEAVHYANARYLEETNRRRLRTDRRRRAER